MQFTITSIFTKLAGLCVDCLWLLLYRWYTNLNIRIKWNHSFSNSIKVCKGTRHGELSSTLIFNRFYKDIFGLNNLECGNIPLNVLCYVDDK